MTTAIARQDTAQAVEYTQEQLQLIKDTICKGSTDSELAFFMAVCKRTGLDPFSRQIYAVKRWDKNVGREVLTTQVSIDGFRSVAEETGELDGQDVVWCGPDGAWKEVWLSKDPPSAAKVVVYRKGASRGFPAVALYSDYVQKDKAGQPTKFWRDMPSLMLSKCAEALALRKAFPKRLGGLYTPDEMGQADNVQSLKPEVRVETGKFLTEGPAPSAPHADVVDVTPEPAPAPAAQDPLVQAVLTEFPGSVLREPGADEQEDAPKEQPKPANEVPEERRPSEKQMRFSFALMKAKFGKTEDADRYAVASMILNRKIDSWKQLDKRDMSKMLDELTKMPDYKPAA